MAAQKLNKDGTVDKRFGKKEGGKIDEIIASQQSPSVSIAPEHQSAPKVPEGKGVDWSHLNCNGVTAQTKKGE